MLIHKNYSYKIDLSLQMTYKLFLNVPAALTSITYIKPIYQNIYE